jgi:TetR/AcrR family transcriptional repressor of nem operon
MGRSPTNSKQKLLETANDLIWQSSYGSVSVDDICTAAEVKKGSFYYYFSSKAELAVAVMEKASLEFESGITDTFNGETAPVKRFEKLAALIYDKQQLAFEKYGRVCGCPFASLGSEMAGNEEAIQQKADEIFHQQGSIFADTIREMVELGLLAPDTNVEMKSAQIVAFILGQLMLARIQNDLSSLKDELRLGLLRTLELNHEEIL